MHDIVIRPNAEISGDVGSIRVGVLAASRPYITVFLLVTISLSVWAGLCSAWAGSADGAGY